MSMFPATTLIDGHMIISIYSEPDRRFPRLALALAKIRWRQSKSVALLDVTAATVPAPCEKSLLSIEAVSGIPLVRARRSMEVELSRLLSLYKDVVIDCDDLSTPVGISGMVAAKTAIVALYPSSMQEPSERKKLIARIERAWLFNPRLQVIVLPVCFGAEPSAAHLDTLKSFAGTAPCIRPAQGCIRDLRTFHRSADAEPCESEKSEASSWCEEISRLHEIF